MLPAGEHRIAGPAGALRVLVVGGGLPITLVVHGLAAASEDVRPLVGGLPGTRVLLDLRGHGGSDAPSDPTPASWGYPAISDDLRAAAEASAATAVVGVSLGAGAALALMAAEPARFEAAVLLQPAALDEPRIAPATYLRLAELLQTQDRERVAAHLLAELPADLRGSAGVEAVVAARAARLLQHPGVLAVAVPLVAASVPVADRAQLAAVETRCLVVAERDDPLHPEDTARAIAESLPRCDITVLDRPFDLYRQRARLRALLTAHLTGPLSGVEQTRMPT